MEITATNSSNLKKCEMFGCEEQAVQAFQIAPGTVVQLCLEHYKEESTRNAR